MILILLRYVKPIEEVDALAADHGAFLDRLMRDGKLVASGPRDPRTGGVLITTFETEVEAMKRMVDDPFFEHGVAEYEAIRFKPTRHDPRFAAFLSAEVPA
jgi:uncharacterized protein YciI